MPVKINGTTSGSVTLAAPDTGSDVTLTLPASTGTVALASALGKQIVQVVQGVSTGVSGTSGTSLTDTGLSATITPSSASSKILVFIHQPCRVFRNPSATLASGGFAVLRGATTLKSTSGTDVSVAGITSSGSFAPSHATNFVYIYLDSPSSTSALTYKTQMRGEVADDNVGANCDRNNNHVESHIILIEIGA